MRGGSAILDKTPPSPEEKVFPSKSRPGDDTNSILGPEYAEDNGPPNSMGKRILQIAQLLMSAVNLADTISPTLMPETFGPQFIQAVAQFAQAAPGIASRMDAQSDPAALLAAIGQAGTQPGTMPMGVNSMGAMGGMSRPSGGGMM